MSLISKATGDGQKTLAPEGIHVGRCYAVVDLGTHNEEWKGEAKKRRKVILSFEFPSLMHTFNEDDGPQPIGRSITYTNNLGEKATLRRHLQSWRGRAFTQKELEGFDLATVCGHAAQIGIIHKPRQDGSGVSDRIDSLIGVPAGLKTPEPVNEPYSYSIEEHPKNWDKLSKWMQEQVSESDEFIAQCTEPDVAPAAAVSDEPPF